jgi:hypothetical protein
MWVAMLARMRVALGFVFGVLVLVAARRDVDRRRRRGDPDLGRRPFA